MTWYAVRMDNNKFLARIDHPGPIGINPMDDVSTQKPLSAQECPYLFATMEEAQEMIEDYNQRFDGNELLKARICHIVELKIIGHKSGK